MEKKLFGIYPGKLKNDTNYIEKCSELELYSQLCTYYEPYRISEYYKKMILLYQLQQDKEMVEYFQNLKEELKDSLTPEYQYTMDYCILQSSRFGTNVKYNENGRVIITDEFKNWYQNWSLYIATMDDDTLAVYRHYRYEGKNLNSFEMNKPIDMDTISDEDKDLITKYQYKPIKSLKKNIKQKLA